MINADDLERCDPGVRDLVGALNAAGWMTCDSGDGVSKPVDEMVFPFAHVVVSVSDPSQLVAHAERLYAWLLSSSAWHRWVVEANYAPHDRSAILFLREAIRGES